MTSDITFLFSLLFLNSAARSQEHFNTTPEPIKSNFTCVGQPTGYYADVPSNCRIYHNCDDQGNKFSYYCPEMTAFRQQTLVCDHAHLVDCKEGTRIGLTTSEAPTILDRSTATTGRWTTGNPSRDSSARKNATVSVSKFSGTNPAGLRFGNTSAPEKNSSQFSRFNFKETSGTFGNSFGKEFFASVKTSGDRLTVNSRGNPAWFKHSGNGGTDFGTRPEVVDRNLEQRVRPTTSTAKPRFNFYNSDYPGLDKGGTRSSKIPVPTSPKTTTTRPTTTEIPFRDYTASLKPLVPNTPEYDPYYPRESWTTTESYYTPSKGKKLPQAFEAPNYEPSLVGVYYKVPDVWPDLNTLDDIVDRRKLFYIPRIKKR